MFKLSKRLDCIYNKIIDCDSLADVGCDHGKLSIYCLKTGKIKYAYLLDLREEPLNQAKSNVIKYQVENRCKLIQSDGLSNLFDKVDCLVISGMGSELILKIIDQSFNKVKEIKSIILQPNKNMALVRNQMAKWGFKIIDEDIIYEDKFYEVACFNYTGKQEEYTEKEIFFGPINLDKKANIFKEYLCFEQNNLKKILNYHNESDKMKYNFILELLNIYDK